MNHAADFGSPISSYTSRQAIADGVLVHPFPERFPGCLLTIGVHAAIETVQDQRTYAQRAIPLLQDAALIVLAGLKRDPDETLWTRGLYGNVTGREVWIGLNDLGGFTLMFPEER